MKAYKLDVSPYLFTGPKGEVVEYPFKVLILNLLFAQDVPQGYEYLKLCKLARKIEEAEGSVILSEEEKNKLKQPFTNIPLVRTGDGSRVQVVRPSINEEEAFRRVLEGIEEVEVEEAKPKGEGEGK